MKNYLLKKIYFVLVFCLIASYLQGKDNSIIQDLNQSLGYFEKAGNEVEFYQQIPNEIPAYLRQGISVDKTTLRIAIEMYAQGWRYTMPSPKSSQASWGNSDGRTTWWYGYWYNNKTRQYSRTVPKKQADGKYLGDYQNDEGYWRGGGSPSAPTKLEWLLSTSGGIKPY